MAKQTQITIPLTSLPAGPRGPFASGTLPAALSGYQVDFTNDASWPAAGDVLTVSVDVSPDNGQTWRFDASITLSGGHWKDQQGVAVNTAAWNVSVPGIGSSTRKMRVTLTVAQPCTLGATISTL